MSQMIVATPQLVPAVQGRMPQLPAWSAARVSGVTRGSRHSAASLTVGSQGVMLTPEEGHHVTVRFDATAALLLWNDEQRTLIGTDGFAVRLDPSEWPDGDAVVRSVDALVPPGLTVAIDGPGPERPRRDQAPAAAATPADADAPRVRPGMWRRIVRGLCFAVVAFGVLAITGGDVSGGIAFVVIGGLGLAWQLLSSQRRIRHRGS
jgi:hypothetical protein